MGLLLHPALPSVFLAECSHHQLNITAQCRCVGRGQARLQTLYYLAGNLTVYCGPGGGGRNARNEGAGRPSKLRRSRKSYPGRSWCRGGRCLDLRSH